MHHVQRHSCEVLHCNIFHLQLNNICSVPYINLKRMHTEYPNQKAFEKSAMCAERMSSETFAVVTLHRSGRFHRNSDILYSFFALKYKVDRVVQTISSSMSFDFNISKFPTVLNG